jgi:hypothetical protein
VGLVLAYTGFWAFADRWFVGPRPCRATEQLVANPFQTTGSKGKQKPKQEQDQGASTRRSEAPLGSRAGRGPSPYGGRGGGRTGGSGGRGDRDQQQGNGGGRGQGGNRGGYGGRGAFGSSSRPAPAPAAAAAEEAPSWGTADGPSHANGHAAPSKSPDPAPISTPAAPAPSGWGTGKSQTMAQRLAASLASKPAPEPPRPSTPKAAPAPAPPSPQPVAPPSPAPAAPSPEPAAPASPGPAQQQPTSSDQVTAPPPAYQDNTWGATAGKTIMSTLNAAREVKAQAAAAQETNQALSTADNAVPPPSSVYNAYAAAPGVAPAAPAPVTSEPKTVAEVEQAMQLSFGSFNLGPAGQLGDYTSSYSVPYSAAPGDSLLKPQQPAAPSPVQDSTAAAVAAADPYKPTAYGTYTLQQGLAGTDKITPAPGPSTVPAAAAPGPAVSQAPSPAQQTFGQSFATAPPTYSNFGQSSFASAQPDATQSSQYNAAHQAFNAYDPQQDLKSQYGANPVAPSANQGYGAGAYGTQAAAPGHGAPGSAYNAPNAAAPAYNPAAAAAPKYNQYAPQVRTYSAFMHRLIKDLIAAGYIQLHACVLQGSALTWGVDDTSGACRDSRRTPQARVLALQLLVCHSKQCSSCHSTACTTLLPSLHSMLPTG